MLPTNADVVKAFLLDEKLLSAAMQLIILYEDHQGR